MKDHIDVNNLDGGRTTIRAEELESLCAATAHAERPPGSWPSS